MSEKEYKDYDNEDFTELVPDVTYEEEDGQYSLIDRAALVERNYAKLSKLKVYKQSDMIQRGRSMLTLREKKIINYLFTKVREDDPPGTEYIFSAQEYMFALNVHGRSKYNYGELMEVIQRLADKSWIIKEGDELKLVRWLNIVHIKEDTLGPGKVKLSFHQDMWPYVHQLFKRKREAEERGDDFFITSYNFVATMPMKRKYSTELYELLLSFKNNESWQFDLDWLREYFADYDEITKKPIVPPKWKNTFDFNQRVLKPSVEEINLYSDDLKVSYSYTKVDLNGFTHSTICGVIFYFQHKSLSEKEQTHDSLYKEIVETASERQQKAFEKAALDEQEINRKIAIDKVMAHVDDVIHGAVEERYSDIISLGFSKEEAKSLYTAAQLNMDISPLNIEGEIEWIWTYIEKNYSLLLGDSKKTKTSTYNRLLDCVTHDRFAIAPKIKVFLRRYYQS